MQLTVVILFPGLIVAAIAAPTAAGGGHLVLVEAVRRSLEAVDAEHAGGIDAALPAAVGGLTVLEDLATNGGGVALQPEFLQRRGGIIAQYELDQDIDHLLLGQCLLKHALDCKEQGLLTMATRIRLKLVLV